MFHQPHFDMERREKHLVWINQRRVNNISLANFPQLNALGEPCCPIDTGNTEMLCIHFVTQAMYTESLNHHKSSSHAHCT